MHIQLKQNPTNIQLKTTKTTHTQTQKEKTLIGVSDVEVIWVLDDNIVHVNGAEFGEIFRERNEING